MVSAAYLLLVNIRNAHRLTPELKYDAKKFSIDSVKELVSSGIWNSINNLGNVLNSGLDLIITNLMLTATAMGQISVAKNLATICYTLVGTIANAFKPLQTRYYAEGNQYATADKTNDTWYGMTYHEDVAVVKDSFKKMLEKGLYKADLFSDL